MASAAELRQILKQDASGKNLYDHLTETLMKVLIDRPSNAYDMFELISADVKSNPLNPEIEQQNLLPPSQDEVSRRKYVFLRYYSYSAIYIKMIIIL